MFGWGHRLIKRGQEDVFRVTLGVSLGLLRNGLGERLNEFCFQLIESTNERVALIDRRDTSMLLFEAV